jgi:anti-sigma regulatory factor (Ser/Thr protein kinase)
MSSDTAVERSSFTHDAALYGSLEELLEIVVPFLHAGLETGEPAVVALRECNLERVRAALGDTHDITFLEAPGVYRSPAGAIKAYQQLLQDRISSGAERMRLVGEVPHPGTGQPWDWWARYEAAVNTLFAPFPLSAICPYDVRITPEDVLADVERTHPQLLTSLGSGRVAGGRFQNPVDFLAHRPGPRADPLESTPATMEEVDPTPADARRAVREAGRAGRLDGGLVEDLVFAVSEAVTNSLCHGQAPIWLRLWTGPDRMVATVTDHGPGPDDPFVGLLPTENTSTAGMGLWATHLLCSNVTLDRHPDGFTIRLVAGASNLHPEEVGPCPPFVDTLTIGS